MQDFGLEEYEDEIFNHVISYDEVVRISGVIIDDYINNNTLVSPSCFPKISVNVAPPASGKSALNTYAANKMKNDCVIINSDDLKMYYPNAKDISASSYAPLYSYISDIGSNLWTSELLTYALEKNFNIIFEGTGKSARILETIEPYRTKYLIKIRTIAVSSTTSLISILSRYINQTKNELCPARLVKSSDFYNAYEGITILLDKAEANGYLCEVFARNVEADKLPVKIYTTYKREGYKDAVEAVRYARKNNAQLFSEYNTYKIGEVKDYLTKNSQNIKVMAAALDIIYTIILLDNQDSSYDPYDF